MADTAKEKALKVIVKAIKELDSNAMTLDVLNEKARIFKARTSLYGIILEAGYEITLDYKLEKQK